MAVTRAPKRQVAKVSKNVDEEAVLEVIQRGGTVRSDTSLPLTDPQKNVQLRLYQSQLDEIDALRQTQAKGRRPLSRHAWILAAIEEKLKRKR